MNNIIFNSQLIPKVMDGSKTQTRRIVKPQPIMPTSLGFDHGMWDSCQNEANEWAYYGRGPSGRFYPRGDTIRKCPYKIGQRVWVRETWCPAARYGYDAPEDGRPGIGDDDSALYPVWYRATDDIDAERWSSPLFMPRWASRLDIIIESIGVERIQEISEEDCAREGFPGWYQGAACVAGEIIDPDGQTPREQFSETWNTLFTNPKPAKHNPYTWAKEDCYVSYPWEDIREEREKNGKSWYVVGSPAVFVYSFRAERREK